ncbi:MAG: hypothetical protein AAB363_06410 [Planctomycetota bacterium]
MMCRRFHMILPVLLLASAAQPVYRLGAFIETAHADRLAAAARADGAATDAPDKPTEERSPQRSWPVELVALFPAGIGSSEQAFRAPSGGRLLLEADSGSSAFCPHDTPPTCRFARPVHAEPSAAALIGVVAHPIHTHAPPPKL